MLIFKQRLRNGNLIMRNFSFKGKNQMPLFMIIDEEWMPTGKVEYAIVVFSTHAIVHYLKIILNKWFKSSKYSALKCL